MPFFQLHVFAAMMALHHLVLLCFLHMATHGARRPYREGDHEQDQQCYQTISHTRILAASFAKPEILEQTCKKFRKQRIHDRSFPYNSPTTKHNVTGDNDG